MIHKNEIDNLIYIFSKLPGLGARSARRIVLHLLKDKDNRLKSLANSLEATYNAAVHCDICYNLSTANPCHVCTSSKRDDSVIAIVENVADLWALERSNHFYGKYHVLGGTLSAGKGGTPETLGLPKLYDRIKNTWVAEVIIATNSTLDGQTTAFYISDYLKELNIKITRLASGIPIGGELDYLDEGTLSLALNLRQNCDS